MWCPTSEYAARRRAVWRANARVIERVFGWLTCVLRRLIRVCANVAGFTVHSAQKRKAYKEQQALAGATGDAGKSESGNSPGGAANQ